MNDDLEKKNHSGESTFDRIIDRILAGVTLVFMVALTLAVFLPGARSPELPPPPPATPFSTPTVSPPVALSPDSGPGRISSVGVDSPAPAHRRHRHPATSNHGGGRSAKGGHR